jgi:hypothetical protein
MKIEATPQARKVYQESVAGRFTHIANGDAVKALLIELHLDEIVNYHLASIFRWDEFELAAQSVMLNQVWHDNVTFGPLQLGDLSPDWYVVLTQAAPYGVLRQ